MTAPAGARRQGRGRRVVVGALLAVAASALALQRTGGFDPPAFTGRLDVGSGEATIRVEALEVLSGRGLLVARVPRHAGVRLRACLLADPGELGSLAAHGSRLGAWVGVNGDYHHLDGPLRNQPQALLVDRGRVLVPTTSAGHAVSFWLDGAGAPHIGALAGPEPDVWLAIGSGPRLLADGAVAPGLAQVDLPGYTNRLARAAVGFGETELILAATPQAPRAGLSHLDMARALLALGCREALALDGGPSATLWAWMDWRGGAVVNLPPGLGGSEPPLASALFALPPAADEPGLE